MTTVPHADIAARYLRFADAEARGNSPLYETLARNVAQDGAVLAFLAELPFEKQQPNLLFACMRHLFGTARDWQDFRRILLANNAAVRSAMIARATQTNEPARCAVLLPVLAQLPQPLALVEVGAAAGLCLLPDFYRYDYGRHRVNLAQTGAPVFSCATDDRTPIPTTMPQIVWRAGLDRNPLDAADPAQTSWLETLVWPEQTARLANLRAGLRIAVREKPRIVKADLLGDGLAQLCAAAPKDATLVIFHTAVLAYVDVQEERDAFAETAQSLCRYWIANESPRVFPGIASQAAANNVPGRFLMAVNGTPVAWTQPHGAAMEWITNGNVADL